MQTMMTLRMVKLVVSVLVSSLCLALLVMSSPVASAASEAPMDTPELACPDADGTEATAASCVLRLQQPVWDTSSPFGGTTRLSQTFVAPVGRKVCRVEVLIVKGAANNDPLFLQVQTLGGVVLDQAVVAAGPIPVGVPFWQNFSFNCDGGLLAVGSTYRLELSAPQSPAGQFKWLRHGASVIPGAGFSRVFPGAPVVIAPFGTDFTFRLFMCY